jgi:3-deoxy-D-manno-octulosonic-acid transferase
LLSFRNKKAKEWIRGRQNWQIHLKEAIGGHTNWVWVHCASAGEFEQGKPVIERLKMNLLA